MQKFYKQKLIHVFLFLLALIPTIVNAQPGFGDDVPDVPIDGGLSVLLIAGAAYGVKKVRSKSRK